VVHAKKLYPGQLEQFSEFSSARAAEKRWHYNLLDSSVLGYSLDSNGVTTETEESPLLRFITKQ
jgi:hypothetical protein